MQPLLVIIVGPTASGKTSFAIRLASKLDTEIISADSRQVYREMKVGTAVPSEVEKKGIKHHLMGHKSIFDNYNAYMFEQEALALLNRLFRKMNPIIMVGGSGLYIDAVCNGIDDIPGVDPEVRQSLQMQYKNEGIESLRTMLKKLDPEYYRQVDLRNPSRLLKALEISITAGKPYSSFLTNEKKERSFKTVKIGIMPVRETLYNQINARVDRMIQSGLVEEARTLYPYRDLKALNTVGYKELFNWLDGNTSLEEAIERIKANTRKYARKQITWFRKDSDILWTSPEDTDGILKTISEHIK